MAEMGLDLQDPTVQREIPVFPVILVCREILVCRDPKEIQDAMGTKVEGETQAGRETRERQEIQDIQDKGVSGVLQEAETSRTVN